MAALIDETRKKYGRLRVICRAGNSAAGHTMWKCKCKCGKEVVVLGKHLRTGHTESCGCLYGDIGDRARRHGRSHTAEYGIWKHIKQRCYNPKVTHYDRYGGRGIRMHESWFHSFEKFYAYVGPRPSRKHSIDRYPNPDGDYEPGNVRWATKSQQLLNTCRTRYVIMGGKKRLVMEVLRERGIKRRTFYDRIGRGWSVARACTQAIKAREPKDA